MNAKVTTDLVYIGTLLDAMREVSHEITRLNKAAGETVFNPAATGALRERMAELEAIVKANQRQSITTALNKLHEDSWTCQCTVCGIRSFHDSDVGKACIKAPLCDGKMEGRMALDLRADRDARR